MLPGSRQMRHQEEKINEIADDYGDRLLGHFAEHYLLGHRQRPI